MSYVSQQFLLFDNSSTANFKNWAKAISDALVSSGWSQTADSGQVNWTTVSVPASGSYVYEIFAPSDPLQTGSTAFYLKIQYGTQGTAPGLKAQLGTGTDGSGNLTGITSNLCVITNGATSTGQGSTLTFDCYFSGDTDRFSMMLWRSLAAQGAPFVYLVERTHATDGTNSSDGVTFASGNTSGNSSNNARGHQTIAFGIGAASITSGSNLNYCALTDLNNASGAFNNNIPVSPAFPVYGKYGNPMTTLAFVHTQDVAAGCIFTTTLYGATRTYICSGISTGSNGSPSQCYLCMRYD